MAKTLKVELTVEEDDGRIILKTLEGEEAEKWQKFVASVCLLPRFITKTLIGQASGGRKRN